MAPEHRTTRVIEISDLGRAASASEVSAAPPVGKLMTLMPERETMSLEELKARMGTLVVPVYLPEGFALEETYFEEGRLATLVYTRGVQRIRVVHDTYPARLRVKEGFSRAVTIGPREGYVVDGVWVFSRRGVREWVPGVFRVVLLDWDEVLSVRVEVFHASAVTGPTSTFLLPQGVVVDEIDEAELIKIAESLQPY